MQKRFSYIIIEIAWLSVSLLLTLLLSFLFFGRIPLNGSMDIHLNDSYIVIESLLVLLTFFSLVVFILYFIKELRNSFRRTLPNWILILIGLILVITLGSLIKTFSQFFIGGFTIYPPLSALGPDKFPELTQDPVAKTVSDFLTILQTLIVAMMLFVSFRWGKQKI